MHSASISSSWAVAHDRFAGAAGCWIWPHDVRCAAPASHRHVATTPAAYQSWTPRSPCCAVRSCAAAQTTANSPRGTRRFPAGIRATCSAVAAIRPRVTATTHSNADEGGTTRLCSRNPRGELRLPRLQAGTDSAGRGHQPCPRRAGASTTSGAAVFPAATVGVPSARFSRSSVRRRRWRSAGWGVARPTCRVRPLMTDPLCDEGRRSQSDPRSVRCRSPRLTDASRRFLRASRGWRCYRRPSCTDRSSAWRTSRSLISSGRVPPIRCRGPTTPSAPTNVPPIPNTGTATALVPGSRSPSDR